MKDSWIIFCPAGKWQIKGINEAKLLGYKTLAIDSDKKAEGFDESDDHICVDTNDFKAVYEEILQKKINTVAILSYCSDVGIKLSAYLRNKFQLNGFNEDVANNLTNKHYQRLLWGKAGLQKNFNWSCFKDLNKAYNYLISSNSKKIIKPVDSSGSRGVSVIDHNKSFLKHQIKMAFEFSNSNEIIVEDFIEGKEYTVEVFIKEKKTNILHITEKNKLKDTGFTVAHEIFTADLSNEIIEKIKNLIDKAAGALSYNNGIGHIEILISKSGKIILIEFAGRGGGFGLNHFFIENVSGLNPTKLTILSELGNEINLESSKNCKAFLKFIPAKVGTIKKLIYPNIVTNNLIIDFFVKEGSVFKSSKSDGDRVGFVFCVSDEIKKSKNLAYKYFNKIKIEYS